MILTDKGYQDLQENFHGIHLKKKHVDINLTQAEISFNGKVSFDHIIVKTFLEEWDRYEKLFTTSCVGLSVILI